MCEITVSNEINHALKLSIGYNGDVQLFSIKYPHRILIEKN